MTATPNDSAASTQSMTATIQTSVSAAIWANRVSWANRGPFNIRVSSLARRRSLLGRAGEHNADRGPALVRAYLAEVQTWVRGPPKLQFKRARLFGSDLVQQGLHGGRFFGQTIEKDGDFEAGSTAVYDGTRADGVFLGPLYPPADMEGDILNLDQPRPAFGEISGARLVHPGLSSPVKWRR